MPINTYYMPINTYYMPINTYYMPINTYYMPIDSAMCVCVCVCARARAFVPIEGTGRRRNVQIHTLHTQTYTNSVMATPSSVALARALTLFPHALSLSQQ